MEDTSKEGKSIWNKLFAKAVIQESRKTKFLYFLAQKFFSTIFMTKGLVRQMIQNKGAAANKSDIIRGTNKLIGDFKNIEK